MLGFTPKLLQHSPKIGSYINPVDRSGIFEAIGTGDRQRLLAIRSTIAAGADIPIIKQYMLDLADAGLARIDGDFVASNAALDRALQGVGRHADTTREVNSLLLLAEAIRNGNLFLSGDIRGWIDHTAWMERTYFAPIRAFYRLPNLQFPNQAMIVPIVPATAIINPSVTASAEEQLPLRVSDMQLDGRHPIEVEVEGSVFGVTGWMMFDTGCLVGLIPAEYVARHHLPIVARTERGSDGFTNDMHNDYVIVPEIRIGKTVFRNQLFEVAPISRMVLGLLQMEELRHLTIDEHTLRFGPDAPFDCHDQIRAGSAVAGGTFRLLFPYRLDGQGGTAALDTGDNSPSVISLRTNLFPEALRASAQLKGLTTAAGNGAYRMATMPATVDFAHFTAQDRIKYIETPIHDTMISTGVLRLARFSLDMTDHFACLKPDH